MNLYVEDGYTSIRKFEAEPGLHPAFSVTFRPALYEERRKLGAAMERGGDALAKHEIDAVRRHVIEVDGIPISKIDVPRIRMVAMQKILNLVFGNTPESEAGDLGNS